MKHSTRRSFALTALFAFTSFSLLKAQEVKIKGKVIDRDSRAQLRSIMVVNKKTGNGTFGDAQGNFVLNISPTDSILVGAIGYTTQIISFRDSVPKKVYDLTIELHTLVINLQPVTIIAERDLEEIKEEISTLGYDPKDYMLSGVDALNSPITFLYQMFSRREQSKRELARLQNEDRKRSLLKALFKKYVAFEIIELTDDQFDDFIDYCQVSDEYMKRASQYEFLMYIQARYSYWKTQPSRSDTLPKINFDKK